MGAWFAKTNLADWALTLATATMFASGCGGENLTQPKTDSDDPLVPAFVMWGLNFCPPCYKRQPNADTELQYMHEAITGHVVESCMETHVGSGSYQWILDAIDFNDVWIDEDVFTYPGWEYTDGYWNPPSTRYQYWGIPIFIAAENVNEDKYSLARVLIHETAHEYGIGHQDDQDAIDIANLCVAP